MGFLGLRRLRFHAPASLVHQRTLEPVRFPAKTVTGGGRAKGFHVERYVPWSEISRLKEQPDVWRGLNCEYLRLSSAYDNFYYYLGFLSPSMSETIASLNQEIFRLRVLCRELRDQRDRLLLMNPHGGRPSEFGRILEEVNKREGEDRRSVLELINRDISSDSDRSVDSSSG
jgi:hypothetical protein